MAKMRCFMHRMFARASANGRDARRDRADAPRRAPVATRRDASRARTDARPTRAPIERARARRTADARRRRDARERARRRRTTTNADADGARVRDRRVDRARRRERRLLGADRDAEDGHEQRVRGELGADARVAAVREHVGVPRMARRRQRRRDARQLGEKHAMQRRRHVFVRSVRGKSRVQR